MRSPAVAADSLRELQGYQQYSFRSIPGRNELEKLLPLAAEEAGHRAFGRKACQESSCAQARTNVLGHGCLLRL